MQEEKPIDSKKVPVVNRAMRRKMYRDYLKRVKKIRQKFGVVDMSSVVVGKK